MAERRRRHASVSKFSKFKIQLKLPLADVDMHTFSHLRAQLIQLLVKREPHVFELILVALSRHNLSDSTLDTSMHAFIWRFPLEERNTMRCER